MVKSTGGNIKYASVHIFTVIGPLGAPNAENIKMHNEQPALSRLGGGNLGSSATRPEYGGSPPWLYTGPDITRVPEGTQKALSEAGELPGGVRL